MKNLIFAVAINEYENPQLNTLRNCETDIRHTLQILNDRYNFDGTDFLCGRADTTGRNLFNRLRQFFIDALPEENIILLYAGHGQFDPILKTAFWQPSDADPEDTSTWFNLNNLVDFLRVTKAHHVGIITDSCFSGAMFSAASRGGGLGAYSGRSREVLTSGGIEKVSDGEAGQASPFSKTLNTILLDNTQEMTFQELGHLVIRKFESERLQTPRFDSLKNVGHEFGSFLFTLKQIDPTMQNRKNPNNFLQKRLKHLFIPLSEGIRKKLDEVYRLTDEKIKIVRQQKYEQAATIRAKEKEAIKELIDQFTKDIDNMVEIEIKGLKLSQEQLQSYKDLDTLIQDYHEYSKIEQEKKEGKVQTEASKKINDSLTILFNVIGNPIHTILIDHKDEVVKLFDKNVIELFKLCVRVLGASGSVDARYVIAEFKALLVQIFEFQIEMLTSSNKDDFDFFFKMKEIEFIILNWIKANSKGSKWATIS